MRVYLLRHGDAEDPSGRMTDQERQLTSEGRAEVSHVSQALKRAKAIPDFVMSSPLVRALQTAEIAAGVLGYSENIARTDVLVPHSNPHSVWEEIVVHGHCDHLLLVGHEPLMSRTAAHLLGAPSMLVKMTTGSTVCIEIDATGRSPRGVLRWMITPRIARS